MRMKNWKALLTALMLVLILAVAVGGTIAWIIDTAGPVENTFTPAGVPSKVVETIEGNVKENVTVKNEGNIPAYIRVAIIANWCDGDGNIIAPCTVPSSAIQSNWLKIDGYYYYNAAVPAQGSTNSLLKSFSESNVEGTKPAGAHLEMTIACQSIQSEPDTVVENMWHVNVENGLITGVASGT